MSLIKIFNFKGKVDKLSEKLLSNEYAQQATNCEVDTGKITPIKDLEFVTTAPGFYVVDSNGDYVIDSNLDDVATLQSEDIFLINDNWMNWGTSGISVVPSFIADASDRFYYTGDGAPKQSDTTLATSGDSRTWPTSYYALGVEQPPSAPVPAISGSAGSASTARTTTYVYTYVTSWLEEGEPSVASALIDVSIGEKVDVTGYTAASGTDNDVQYVRTYRVATGQSLASYNLVYPEIDAWVNSVDYTSAAFDLVTNGGTSYMCILDNGVSTPVVEPGVTAGWATYWEALPTLADIPREAAVANGITDDNNDEDLGSAIVTEDFNEPPANLSGLILFNGNTLIGFADNELYFSEPNYPYAWPASYSIGVNYNIVGLGKYKESIIILTDGIPAIVTGFDPQTVTLTPFTFHQPCLARRGIVSTEGGVLFPAEDGLYSIDNNQAVNITKDLYTREQWQALDISNIFASFFDNKYHAFFTSSNTGFILDLNDPSYTIDISLDSDKLFLDSEVDGEYLYVSIKNTTEKNYTIHKWAEASTDLTYTWKSKKFQFFDSMNFKVARIVNDETSDLTVNFYVDDILKFTKSVTSDSHFKLPGGFRGREFEIELTGTSEVDVISVANSVREMLGE